MQETARLLTLPEREFPSTNICMNYEGRATLADILEECATRLRYADPEHAAAAIRRVKAALAGWGA